MLRIIAGEWKGLRLEIPKGPNVRPTLDRVRESSFNILGQSLTGLHFADLFAGTGANGIEALSRHAASCVFVDSDLRCIDTIKRNLAHTKVHNRARLMRLKLPAGLEVLSKNAGPFDVIYADPPFDFSNYSELLKGVSTFALLSSGGRVIIEHDAHVTMPSQAGELTLNRETTYGKTRLSFFS
ncbi:MAG: methyltransferase [Candidatus Hydrogenedentota bacterium]